MSTSRSGLPEHPDQTFTMAPAGGVARAAPALPPLPRWATAMPDAADATGTFAGVSGAGPEFVPSLAEAAGGEGAPAGYRLLRKIGEGGAGEVWEAEQSGLSRVVAVKRLRRREDVPAKNLLREAEFRSESVIAASLEHPNILPVYDLGRDGDGAPMLAMKRVHGRPWNELLKEDFADLSADALLNRHIPILVAVTQAVAFAHSRGIVHRDIKPAQVLVGEFGEVLLTDWGLALQAGMPQAGTASSLKPGAPTPDTATSPAGTPSLMAPEQTETSGMNLGPWTDVYLLGGTLYYLLTGHYPHESEDSESAFAHARAGRVDAPSVRAPGRFVPPELERLCLAALEPEKEKRPPSAAAFLKGLQDYLSGAARKEKSAELAARVEAGLSGDRPDYAGFTAALAMLDEVRRLWPDHPKIPALRQRALFGSAELALEQGDLRFARLQCDALDRGEETDALTARIEARVKEIVRRRALLRAATAAVLGLLLVIAAGALWFSHRMRAANEEIARRAEEAEGALRIARERGAGAFELIDFVLKDLKAAMDAELTPERGIDKDARNAIAHAVAGKVATPIVKYFESARSEDWPADLQLEHARQMRQAGLTFNVSLARYGEAEKMFESALALLERTHPDSDDLAEVVNNLGLLYSNTNRFDEAEAMLRRALGMLESRPGAEGIATAQLQINLAQLRYYRGDFAQAESLLRLALPVFERHEHENRIEARNLLGMALESQGRYADAVDEKRRALDLAIRQLGPDHASIGVLTQNYASSLARLGRFDEAEPLFRRAIALHEANRGPNHAEVGIFLGNFAAQLVDVGRGSEAEPLFRRAMAILDASLGPTHTRSANVKVRLGALLAEQGKTKEAETLLRPSLAALEAAYPDGHVDLGVALAKFGALLQRTGRLTEAKAQLARAAEMLAARSGPEHRHTLEARRALAEVEAALAARPGIDAAPER